MKKTVPVNGTCPVLGGNHTIYVDYIFAGDTAHKDVWIKGVFDCRESSLHGNPLCRTCPIYLNAPNQKG